MASASSPRTGGHLARYQHTDGAAGTENPDASPAASPRLIFLEKRVAAAEAAADAAREELLRACERAEAAAAAAARCGGFEQQLQARPPAPGLPLTPGKP
jgi:phage protein D